MRVGTRMGAAAFLAVVLMPAVGGAQVVTEMTPERIREAIALGQRESPNLYELKGPRRSWSGRMVRGRVYGYFDTPFLRVAMIAAHARKLGDPQIPENLAGLEGLINPIVVLIIHPAKPPTMYAPVVKVHRAVFECAGRRIEPLSIEESTKVYTIVGGVTRDVTGIETVFPLEVLAAPCKVLVATDQEKQSELYTDERLLAKIR
jgi:hypothetical protein